MVSPLVLRGFGDRNAVLIAPTCRLGTTYPKLAETLCTLEIEIGIDLPIMDAEIIIDITFFSRLCTFFLLFCDYLVS